MSSLINQLMKSESGRNLLNRRKESVLHKILENKETLDEVKEPFKKVLERMN